MARRRKGTRWLARRGTVDYGPYSEEELMECIARRELDLGTLICEQGTHNWQPVGAHTKFRDYYSTLHERWAREEAESAAETQAKRMEAAAKVKGGAWKIAVIGVIVVLAFGSWIVYRIVHAEPTGIANAVALPDMPPLPAAPEPVLKEPTVTVVAARKVRKLRERRNYDTAGVGLEGTGPAPTTSFAFKEDGSGGGAGLSQSQINKVVSRATPGVVACANKAAAKGAGFSKVNVSFLVRSGRLGGITLSRKALKNKSFVACVKSALRRVSVPKFGGPERRVTIPIRLR